MIKICFLVSGDKPVPAIKGGAVETLVQNLINENELCENKNFEFTVLTIGDSRISYSEYKNTKFVIIPSIYSRFNKVYWKLVGLTRKIFKKELVAPFTKVAEYKFLKRNVDKFDLVIEETNLSAIEKIKNKIDTDKIIYHLHYEGETTKSNDELFGNMLAISQYVGKNWANKTGRDESTIHILKNCIDVNKFLRELDENEYNELRAKYSIANDQVVAIYVGRIIEQKGVLEMLNALELANKTSIVLLLVGSANFAEKTLTSYERKVAERIKTMKTRVIQTGYVENEELYKYYGISDFSIVPSVWNEPAGLVVLEAEASGLPVVASNVGGIPEFFCQEAGILVERDSNFVSNLANAIDKMTENKSVLKDMGKKARSFACQYNSEEYYKSFTKIINTIIDNKKRSTMEYSNMPNAFGRRENNQLS